MNSNILSGDVKTTLDSLVKAQREINKIHNDDCQLIFSSYAFSYDKGIDMWYYNVKPYWCEDMYEAVHKQKQKLNSDN